MIDFFMECIYKRVLVDGCKISVSIIRNGSYEYKMTNEWYNSYVYYDTKTGKWGQQMLNKFTVLACYCIYFSKTKVDYAHMFFNVARANNTENYTDGHIAQAGADAIEFMKVNWNKKKEEKYKLSSADKKQLSVLNMQLTLAKNAHSRSHLDGGELLRDVREKEIRKIQNQIKNIESKVKGNNHA